MPGSGCATNDLAFIFLVIDDGANTEAHHRQRRRILGCTLVGLGKRVDVFRIRYRGFEFAPGKLKDNK